LEPLGEDSLGLLDDGPAVQRQLQLPGHDLLLAHGPFCSMPMVATSTDAVAATTPAGGESSGVVLNRFSVR